MPGEGSGSVLAACESRRVKRRDEILSEKNEQKVSAMEGDGMELGTGDDDLR